MKKRLSLRCMRLLLIVLFLSACDDDSKQPAKIKPTAEQLKNLQEKSNCSGGLEDFELFRTFAYDQYIRKITNKSIRELELIDLTEDDGIIVKAWGHALSQQLNYLKAGTPQYERWKNIEADFQVYLVCIASNYVIYVLGYTPGTVIDSDDERLSDYQDEIDNLWRGAIAGKFDEEVSEKTGVAEGSVASFFGQKEDPANKQDMLLGPEETVLGYWRNTSMKFGSTVITLVGGSSDNSLTLRTNREYDYKAHTQGAKVVVTRGNWRYYKNGPKAYLALEHTMQEINNVFKPIEKKRESVFRILEISSSRMMLFEDKGDPEYSVTLVYEK